MLPLVSLAFAALFAINSAIAQTCYYPNGTESEGARVCDPDAEYSACCGQNDECLTNGLCRAVASDPSANDFWRDTCTDQSWESDACPKYCYNGTTNPLASRVNYFVAGCSVDTYCCADPKPWSEEGNYYCCDDQDQLFTAGQPEYFSGPSVAIEAFAYTTAGSSTSSSTATTSSQASTTASQSTGTANPASASATTSPQPPSGGNDNSTAIGVGVGVGVGGALLIIAGIGFFLWRRKQKRRTHDQSQSADPSTNYAPSQGWQKEQAYNSPQAPPYSAYDTSATKPPQQQANQYSELGSEGGRVEMAGMGEDRPAAELPAGRANV